MKAIYWILVQLWVCGVIEGSRLLKVPRIYNALITSDEDLVPSQAYPAVAPVLRPSPPLYLTQQLSQDAHSVYNGFKPEEATPPAQAHTLVDESQLFSWDKFKNNKPADPNILDVPPPPLPVTFRQGKL